MNDPSIDLPDGDEVRYVGEGDQRQRVVLVAHTREADFDASTGIRRGLEMRRERCEPVTEGGPPVCLHATFRRTAPMLLDDTFEMAAERSQAFSPTDTRPPHDHHCSWRPRTGSGLTGRGSSYHWSFDDGSTMAVYYWYVDDCA